MQTKADPRLKSIVLVTMLAVLIFLLAACRAASAVPTDEAQAGHVLIAEILGGIEGDNLHEFIELYNPQPERADLTGWSLEYKLSDADGSVALYDWEIPASIGPNGSLLLVHSGFYLGVTADAYFEQGLNLTSGGLRLIDDTGQMVDQVGWGSAPVDFTEDSPAPALQNGISLERLPGGSAGSTADTDDNLADFVLREDPAPRNTGSGPTPGETPPFSLTLDIPAGVAPGDTFPVVLQLSNNSDQTIANLELQLPLPAPLGISQKPPDLQIAGTTLQARSVSIEGGASQSWTIQVRAPWTYLTLPLRDVFARDAGGRYAYANPAWLEIREGVIPIGVSRNLIDTTVKVEGLATMYTGGYFAGSGNVKFYLQDESGGVQVWVPSGEGSLAVNIGDRVQVTGEMQLYRGARELVATPETVIILDAEPGPRPLEATIQQASLDIESLPGQLVSVEGTANRIEEFSYSFEVDLIDPAGNLLTLYIDKQTEMSVEQLELGRDYQSTGILEVLDSTVLLYPRIADDLVEIYPEEILLSAEAPLTTLPGVPFTISLQATNHTRSESYRQNLILPWPQPGLTLLEIEDGGVLEEGEIHWWLPSLDPEFGSISVKIRVAAVPGQTARLVGYYLLSPAGGLTSEGIPLQIFLGDEIPIWALQGAGESSSYKLKTVTTSGIVTGVFPDLGGLWLQNPLPDDDPSTSEGIFIACGEKVTSLKPGDMINVTGVVREIAAQTQIAVQDCSKLDPLSSRLSLPEARSLDPPVDPSASAKYYESLEGMLVAIEEPAIVIGPSSRYGETFLLLEKLGVERLYRGDPTGAVITIDDGTDAAFEDRDGMTAALAVGDRVTRAIGPLAYTFGAYKIEPIEALVTNSQPLPQIPSSPILGNGQFSVMTWNVENLFDILAPHPSSPPRPRKAEYEQHLERIARTIIAAGSPAIIALQEVENVGILDDLAALGLLSEFSYHGYLLEGTDSRGIDVGYLIREDLVQVLDLKQLPAPEGLTSRPPLSIHVRVREGGQELVLFNNHFLSLSGGEAATEPRRTAQAAWNASLVEAQLESEPGVWVAVLGDLNSFFVDPPIERLRGAGLKHVFDAIPASDRYTYVFQGVSQSLDHILVSEDMWEELVEVTVLHLDADYPPPVPGDPSPWRESDHDPVVAVFELAP